MLRIIFNVTNCIICTVISHIYHCWKRKIIIHINHTIYKIHSAQTVSKNIQEAKSKEVALEWYYNLLVHTVNIF